MHTAGLCLRCSRHFDKNRYSVSPYSPLQLCFYCIVNILRWLRFDFHPAFTEAEFYSSTAQPSYVNVPFARVAFFPLSDDPLSFFCSFPLMTMARFHVVAPNLQLLKWVTLNLYVPSSGLPSLNHRILSWPPTKGVLVHESVPPSERNLPPIELLARRKFSFRRWAL